MKNKEYTTMEKETISSGKNNSQSEFKEVLGQMPSFDEHIPNADRSKNEIENEQTSRGDKTESVSEMRERILSQFQTSDETRQDYENEDIDKTTVSQEIDPGTREALKALDENAVIMDADKYCIVGVVGGVKQATMSTIYIPKGKDEQQVTGGVEAILDRLGMKYAKKIIGQKELLQDKDREAVIYCISKTESLAQLTKELIDKSQEEEQTGEATRELGHILGFPETATEYYIKIQKDKVPYVHTPNQRYWGYIHSPEHEEEEYQQYEARINPLFDEYCPSSAKQLSDSLPKYESRPPKKHSFLSRLSSFFKRK